MKELKDLEFNYEKNNNNNYIISKMAAKMAAENPILVYLCCHLEKHATVIISKYLNSAYFT